MLPSAAAARPLTPVPWADSIALAMVCLYMAGCLQAGTRARPSDAGTVGGDAGEGAVALVVPGAGAHEVPTNLARVVVASPDDPGPLLVRAPDGTAAASHAAEGALSCEAAHCAALTLDAPLA